jgi:hypothetical protein
VVYEQEEVPARARSGRLETPLATPAFDARNRTAPVSPENMEPEKFRAELTEFLREREFEL